MKINDVHATNWCKPSESMPQEKCLSGSDWWGEVSARPSEPLINLTIDVVMSNNEYEGLLGQSEISNGGPGLSYCKTYKRITQEEALGQALIAQHVSHYSIIQVYPSGYVYLSGDRDEYGDNFIDRESNPPDGVYGDIVVEGEVVTRLLELTEVIEPELHEGSENPRCDKLI